jgi:Fibrinogen beta and gamma chains, C-terminal globular domain
MRCFYWHVSRLTQVLVFLVSFQLLLSLGCFVFHLFVNILLISLCSLIVVEFNKPRFNVVSMLTGDSLSLHVGRQFTTKDNDNDEHPSVNCAVNCKGAWWYKYCLRSNLNGYYYTSAINSWDSVNWLHWKNNASLKRTEMKITPFV